MFHPLPPPKEKEDIEHHEIIAAHHKRIIINDKGIVRRTHIFTHIIKYYYYSKV